jgi:hypothetical protein
MFLSLLSACAGERIDLVGTGAVKVEPVPVPRSAIRYVSVSSDADQTVVSGRVKRLGVFNDGFNSAQIRAKAVYPDGSIQTEVDQHLMRLPKARNFRAMYPEANFRIVFPQRLPDGTTLYLKFVALAIPREEETLGIT